MKILLYFILVLEILAPIQTQAQEQTDSIQQAILEMYSQLLVYPQEKLYVQTDKPYYINGETIFFRAFLLHASILKPMNASRYVYVELVAPDNGIIIRQQIRVDSDKMFFGNLILPEELPEGNYRLRAYTRYMENFGEEFFYSRTVFIADPNAIKKEIETEINYIGKNKIKVGLLFKDYQTKKNSLPQHIEWQLGKEKKVTKITDQKDWVYETFNFEEDTSDRSLLISYKNDYNTFSTYLHIPYNEESPQINFYPEGGDLIDGVSNRVAFKALLPDGRAAEVSGHVFNSAKEKVISFRTAHEGMGAFTFTPQREDKYYAEVVYDSKIIRIDLPEAKTKTFALQAVWQRDKLAVSVRKRETMLNTKLFLLIHRQGVPTYFQEWNYPYELKIYDRNEFASGVSHLILLDENFNPVSQRLIFNYLNDMAKVELKTDKKVYKSRELVMVNIDLDGVVADSIPASFAISVTDDKDVKIDTTTNIIAEMLLVSELKGRINNPVQYFSCDSTVIHTADLLMLTHGWRKYHVDSALKGNLQNPAIKPEVSQSLSGTLKDMREKPYAKGRIKMTAVGYDFSQVVEADEKGCYSFSNFEFPDSTAYQLLSYTKEKTKEIAIIPDNIEYPKSSIIWSYGENIDSQKQNDNFVEFVSKANLKYIQENGMRKVFLPEVTVRSYTRKKRDDKLDNLITAHFPSDKRISPKEIEQDPPVTFEELINRIPGISNKTNAAIFIVDGNRVDCTFNELGRCVNISDIAQVEIYTDIPKLMFFKRPDDGPINVVVAFTRWPMDRVTGKERNKSFVQLILPLGYQLPVSFYSPKYDTPEAMNNPTPDLRSTIYWKPNVMVDKDNKTSFNFYTADSKTSYSVVIEGVTNKRQLIYYRKDAIIKVNE